MNQKQISDTPETDAVWESNRNKPPIELEAALCECSGKLERERNEAIRVLRVFKSDVDHLGHWIPDPCRKMVESFLTNAKCASSGCPDTTHSRMDVLRTIAVSDWKTAGELRKMARDAISSENATGNDHE